MIEMITAADCPHCLEQLAALKSGFFEDEYKVIEAGTDEFEKYPEKDLVEGVPFIVVRGDDGVVRYAKLGKMSGEELRDIERQIKRAYLFP
jgi:glutaredoxin